MSDYRAKKSGFAAEAQQKNDQKYDENVAAIVMQWIQRTLQKAGDPTPVNTSPKVDDVHETLKNGFILARLVNHLCGGIAAKFREKPATLPFKVMEVIGKCTDEMKKYGVSTTEVFQTVDLWEKQNMWQVILALQALSRKAMTHGHDGIGPKEAEANQRNFTEEQLKAGSGVIGLQMGYNKGANQAGMNIGNTRHIVD